jgi:hypothetical protein
MSRHIKPHPVPVIEALRQRIRERGIYRVAEEFGYCISYTRALSTGNRKMTVFAANKLGFEPVIIWLPKEKKEGPK